MALGGAGRAGDDADIEKRLADADRYLSSDLLEGRGLTTHGIELAAEYITGQFRALGLKMDLCDGQCFQRFAVTTSAELGPQNRLALVGPASPGDKEKLASTELILGKDYTPLAASDSTTFEAPLVFVGYGITDLAAGYDDYAGVDVTGKVVVILRQEPLAAEKTKASRHCLLRRKVSNAYEHGAAAVVLLTNWSDLRARESRGESLLKQTSAGVRSTHPDLPVLHLRRAVLEPAIRAAYGRDLADVEAVIDRGPRPQSRDLGPWRLQGRTDIRRVQTEVKNIVALLPGSGRFAKETVAIGAHYDHFGYVDLDVNGKTRRAYYSGADDNASGVSAMLEIARYLARSPRRPARNVLFLAFSAEEKGLLGSSYYVGHPIVPLEETVAMLNLDMVGRLNANKLYIRGSFTAAGWGGLLERLNTPHALSLDLQLKQFGSSDQLSFYAKEVPIVHFFTGRHEDYHETTDKFEKLNIPGMRRITQLAEDFVVAVADAPTRPQYVAAVPPEDREPYFGAFGDFTRPEPGYGLGPVAKGSPAELAGLRDGDLVVQFGKDRIAGEDDFREAITHYTDGQPVPVVVKRGNRSRSFRVLLRSPERGGRTAVVDKPKSRVTP